MKWVLHLRYPQRRSTGQENTCDMEAESRILWWPRDTVRIESTKKNFLENDTMKPIIFMLIKNK